MSSPTKPEHPLIEDVDPMASFFYTPRALTVMIGGLLALAYFSDALGLDPTRQGASWESQVKGALIAFVGAFLGYSALYAPHTFMIRPHVSELVPQSTTTHMSARTHLVRNAPPFDLAFLLHPSTRFD